MRPRLTAATLALVAALALAGCSGGESDDETTDASGTATCESVEAPPARADGGAEPPTEALDADTTYTLTFTTNCGDFTVTLDTASAPQTTASLVSLARSGFFDDTVVHRIIPGFVVQGGDPTGTGSGGPGYQTVDPPAADAGYTRGVVAMAKTEVEAPGTAGSQFFVVTGDDVGLPPDYAIVGEVTSGMDVIDAIGQLGDQSGLPSETVVVSSVTVAES